MQEGYYQSCSIFYDGGKTVLTIDELITILEKAKERFGNLQVCKVGFYGEIHEMDCHDIEVCKAQPASGIRGARRVVNLDTPGIGPEPD